MLDRMTISHESRDYLISISYFLFVEGINTMLSEAVELVPRIGDAEKKLSRVIWLDTVWMGLGSLLLVSRYE